MMVQSNQGVGGSTRGLGNKSCLSAESVRAARRRGNIRNRSNLHIMLIFMEFRSIDQVTTVANRQFVSSKNGDRSKTSEFCIDSQSIVWCLYPGRMRPGLIEA